ncbi:MAG: hypothetical protein C0403_07765 [Desulfobacterium sp.]|nr:hypothetical protein [Desulfobacterium sp.]
MKKKLFGETDILTHITGLAMQHLYGRDEKLPRILRRLLLFIPERFSHVAKLSFFHDRLPIFNPEKTNYSVIPINQNIEGAENMALPIEIIDRLIEKSGTRVIMKKCICRHNYDCSNYPDDVACLFLGESALETPKNWQIIADKDQARQHARKAVSLGLVPMVGKIRFDSDTLGIVDRGKLMTICFCCECCCLGRFMAPLPAHLMDRLQHPVEGMTIEVTDQCIGCGECIDTCYLKAIEIVNGRAVKKDICRLCGRCAARCRQRAIKIRLENPDVVDDVVTRLLSVVEI